MNNNILPKNKLKWYVANTRNNSERKVRTILERMGIEHFLPLRKTFVEHNGKKTQVMKSIVPNLIFIKTNYKTALYLANDYGLPISYMIDHMTKHIMIVPDKQMEDFIFLLEFPEEAVQVSNSNLRQGDRVRVIQGEFAGIEGELIRIKGHKRVVVRLRGLFSLATTYIPGAYLEKIDNYDEDSKTFKDFDS